jgi:hypothetical protein
MEIYVRPRKLGEIPVGALVMLPLFALPWGGWMLEHDRLHFGRCAMKVKFELPCLSCGATRGTLRLFHGDLLGALAFQPMMISLYAAILLWGAISLWGFIRRERVVIYLSDREDLLFKAVIIFAPILNWLYLWQMKI